jgi:isocitrate dehydrogenase
MAMGSAQIMDATLRIIQAAGAALDIETIDIGEKFISRAIPQAAERMGQFAPQGFLKAPITTPQGGGFKVST